MNDPDDHWQIDGVSDEARQAAIDAAGRDGVALGDWIEFSIRDAVSTHGTVADIVKAIEALSERIVAAEERTRLSIEPLRERLAELSRQIAEIEHAERRFGDGDDAAAADGEMTGEAERGS